MHHQGSSPVDASFILTGNVKNNSDGIKSGNLVYAKELRHKSLTFNNNVQKHCPNSSALEIRHRQHVIFI